MKRKIIAVSLAVIFAVFSPLVIIYPGSKEEVPPTDESDEGEVSFENPIFNESISSECEVSILMGDESAVMDIEEYLIGVVAGEMPASFEEAALMAQAVAARTYTLYKMWVSPSPNHDETVCTDPACCKAYADEARLRENWGEDYERYMSKIRHAVWSTQGVYMVYDNEPVLAVFHSSSAGKTENSGNVWNEDVPYLVSVESPENEESVLNYISTTEIEYDEFKMIFTEKYPNAEFSENENEWITDIVYSDSGRINAVSVGGVEIRGTELRSIFNLRSTAVTVAAGSDGIIFTVTGYGHGVGLSQYGAECMAKEGSTWQEILKWYYTGIEFATLLSAI